MWARPSLDREANRAAGRARDVRGRDDFCVASIQARVTITPNPTSAPGDQLDTGPHELSQRGVREERLCQAGADPGEVRRFTEEQVPRFVAWIRPLLELVERCVSIHGFQNLPKFLSQALRAHGGIGRRRASGLKAPAA